MRIIQTFVLGVLFSGCIVVTDRPVYDRCDTASDCELAADDCYLVTYGSTDGLCSLGCASDNQCPTANGYLGACYALDSASPFICFERCDYDSDCPAFYNCIPATDGVFSDAICLPY